MAPPKIFLENLIPDPEVFSCVLPPFPVFKKIELSDKEAVEKITRRFPPYSDFNFVSMWSWDVHGNMGICQLNGNLVVRFTDYVTGEPFYSFLGNNNPDETAQALLQLCEKEGLRPELKLLPECVAKHLDPTKFKIQEDRDNFDYIYDVSKLTELKGKTFQTQRNLVNYFIKTYQNWEIKIVDLNESYHKNNILLLFEQWVKNKGDTFLVQECKNEFSALNRIFLANDSINSNLTCFEIYIGNKLTCFSINERIGEYNIMHFEKADTNFKGSYQLLMQQNSKILQNFNIKYLNFEQDLGSPSLRFSKNAFRPSSFLKKYVIINA